MADYHPAFSQHCVKVSATYTIAAAGTKTAAIDVAPYNAGMYYLTTEFNGDTITYEAAEDTAGTFAPTYDGATKDSYTSAAAAGWQKIPSHLFAAGAIKIVTSVGVAADADIIVCLKAGA